MADDLSRDLLEQRVRERTLELTRANQALQAEIDELKRVQRALQANEQIVAAAGSIEARSAGPSGENQVRLPLATAATRTQKPATGDRQGAASAPKCRILVADDNRDSADSLSTLLRLTGHEVRTVFDGLEAMRTAESFRPDVALLDIGMPNANGYQVAEFVRQQPAIHDITLIAMTGWGQEEDKRRSLQAGFDHHLTKPVNPGDLTRLLAQVRVRAAE